MVKRLSLIIACLFFIGPLAQTVVAVVHEVGGSFGWNVPPNRNFYSNWARNKTFFVGDELSFKSKSEENLHNYALPETQEEFDGCKKPGIVFIKVSMIPNRAGRYYFICTVDNHCELGMKFSIDVLAKPGAPIPGSASSSFTLPSLPLFLSAASAMLFLPLIH